MSHFLLLLTSSTRLIHVAIIQPLSSSSHAHHPPSTKVDSVTSSERKHFEKIQDGILLFEPKIKRKKHLSSTTLFGTSTRRIVPIISTLRTIQITESLVVVAVTTPTITSIAKNSIPDLFTMISCVGMQHERRNKQNSIIENTTKNNKKQETRTKQNKKTVRISSLNGKGMLLLLLILMTETVTLSKAVRIVPPTTQAPPPGGSGSGVGVGGTMTGTGTDSWVDPLACSHVGACPSEYAMAHSSSSSPQANPTNKSSAVPGIATVIGSHHRNDNDNKPRRQHTVVAPEVVTTYTIPRGGDVVADTVTAAAASMAAAGTAAMAASTTTMPFNIPNTGWKIIFQVVLTTLNVFCWLVPLQMKSFGENKLVLSLANAFSGGVFLSLAFGHLIPECVAGFTSLVASSSSATTPTLNPATPYMLVLSGYLLIFFVEKVAFDADGILHELEHGGGSGNTKGVPNQTSNANAKSKQVGTASTTNNTMNSGRSAVILLAALAVHSILEMAALGLSDTFKDSAILTISIALHQVRVVV